MKRGFSLVELSIVLVILGLLTGGILAGQSLIRASELRAVTSEYQRYLTATHTFRSKYLALPGDILNATSFWGEAHIIAATCLTTPGTGTQTCNGNGNGQITTAAAGSERGESFSYWSHLAFAGLVEGTYSGFAGSGGSGHAVPATNVPQSKISTAAWMMLYRTTLSDGNFYDSNYENSYTYGRASAAGTPFNPVLRPEEAWNLDTKLDDGKPATGKVMAIHWNNLCAAADDGTHASNDFAASYKLTDTAIRCGLIFKSLF